MSREVLPSIASIQEAMGTMPLRIVALEDKCYAILDYKFSDVVAEFLNSNDKTVLEQNSRYIFQMRGNSLYFNKLDGQLEEVRHSLLRLGWNLERM